MASVRIEKLCKTFDEKTNVVDDVSVCIPDNEFVVIVGPSGCGKTTTLNIIAGLEKPSSGHIFIDDECVDDVEPKDRNIAMVFQTHTLYPHLSVKDNLAFPLRIRRCDKELIEQRVSSTAEMLGISALLSRKPRQLSGGQMQRVAIGKAIVREPKVFLMDEPLSNLDESLNRIILFFVINTPCIDLSSSRLPLTEYGWGKNVWQNDVLKNVLLDQANLKRGETFVIAKSINDMKNACETARLKKGFHNNRENERIAIYKPSKYNEFMSVFYHIRNALAHGRLAMYPIGDGVDITFALEAGVKKNEEFQVRSRMILRKSTLINWIEIIQAGPLGTL